MSYGVLCGWLRPVDPTEPQLRPSAYIMCVCASPAHFCAQQQTCMHIIQRAYDSSFTIFLPHSVFNFFQHPYIPISLCALYLKWAFFCKSPLQSSMFKALAAPIILKTHTYSIHIFLSFLSLVRFGN